MGELRWSCVMWASLLLAAGTRLAAAADVPVAGDRLRWGPTRNGTATLFALSLHDPAIDLSATDPTVDGLRVGFANDTDCHRHVDPDAIVLPSTGWRRRAGAAPSFSYRDDARVDGARQVRRATLRPGRIQLQGVFGGEIAALVADGQGRLGVEVEAGGDRYCGSFGGVVGQDAPGRFSARRAPRPAACTVATPPTCGDGVAECPEACDDGNRVDGDGCSHTCTIELPGPCGDGVVNLGETCDDGNTVDGDVCPADCRIRACATVTDASRTVHVLLSVAPEVPAFVGVTLLLDYQEQLLSLPGSGSAAASRVTPSVPLTLIATDDLEYALRLQARRFDPIVSGTLWDVRFDACATDEVMPGYVACTVESATTSVGDELSRAALSGISCLGVIE